MQMFEVEFCGSASVLLFRDICILTMSSPTQIAILTRCACCFAYWQPDHVESRVSCVSNDEGRRVQVSDPSLAAIKVENAITSAEYFGISL